MSENKKISEAYEKMFEDGSAYKPIRLNQPMPSMAEAMGGKGKTEIPLGEKAESHQIIEDNQGPDYSAFDKHMQEKVDALRDKIPSGDPNVVVQGNGNLQKEVARLEKRVEMLEQALSLVMETQKKLIAG